jgi:hypothetical protein
MRSLKEISAKLAGITLFFGILSGCIDPFYPKVQSFQSLLVVDALVTNENASYYCRLSRSFEKLSNKIEKVRGAKVTINDDLGAINSMLEISPGVYRSDSLTFRGVVGRSYVLSIFTKEGEKYESESARMYDVPDLDSVYFGKDSEIFNDGLHEGTRIYFDSKKPVDGKYLLWSYEEWWKFHVPFPKLYDFIDENHINPVLVSPNVMCWKHNKSDNIIIGSAEADLNNRFVKKPLLFIASDRSDRLMIQYYVKVKQYSLSKMEYDFWDHMKQINEAGGDIFDRQPFQIISNINNLKDSKEQVLGYFRVSAVKYKSLYITRREINLLGLKDFNYGCDLLFVGPSDDFPNKPSKPVTFTQMYHILVDQGYTFIDFNLAPPEAGGGLAKLIFVRNYCSDCSITGSPNKPSFWIDMN